MTRALNKFKNLCFNGLLLTKVYRFELTKGQRSYVWLHWRLMQNLKESWLVLSKMTWRIRQIFVHRLKISDFLLESKMAKLNIDQMQCEKLFYFGNKWIVKLTKPFIHVLQNYCSWYIRKFPRKLSIWVVFFNGQYIYFYEISVSEKLI